MESNFIEWLDKIPEENDTPNKIILTLLQSANKKNNAVNYKQINMFLILPNLNSGTAFNYCEGHIIRNEVTSL